MTINTFMTTAIKPALTLLPAKMDSAEARALILAICLQESRLMARRQKGNGPARGYAQFERGGIHGVLAHDLTKAPIESLCYALDIAPNVDSAYQAIEFNDVLCVGFARCLLWTLDGGLPGSSEPWVGWDCYIDAWRPGKPHRETWNAVYAQAWEVLGKAQELHV